MTVAIVDYGSGNLHSALKAFERASREMAQAEEIEVTSDPDKVRSADRVVLPGVGAFADCRRGIFAVDGMVDAMEDAVFNRGRPFLGICVGMQLLASRGLEHGEIPGLGWLQGDVVPIEPLDRTLKVPHMGWNTLETKNTHPLLDGICTGEAGEHAYFVHSYHFQARDSREVIAETPYAGSLAAIVGRGNIVGTQFHPEKSQSLGLRLISNFLRWKP